jgi:hypothetical protein
MSLAEYQGMFKRLQQENEYLKKELYDKMTSQEMCCDTILKELEDESSANSKKEIKSLIQSLDWKAKYIKGLIR